MLKAIAGIQRVQKLYIELLYSCNFRCHHCFHGKKLDWKDTYTLEEAERLILTFKEEYSTNSVTFVGGEPFLYEHLVEIIRFTKSLGLKVEICTNGYRIQKTLREVALDIDKLRVSLEGLETANDRIRHPGSFKAALETLELAQSLGIYTGVILTVNALNIMEVMPLTYILAPYGVKELKLHELGIVGNVIEHEDLIIKDRHQLVVLYQQISAQRSNLPMTVLLSEDLDPQCNLRDEGQRAYEEFVRVEAQPDGRLYTSCKDLGLDCNVFFFDKSTGQIHYRPGDNNELKPDIPQVRYYRV